jgi:hypothetical protein
MSAQGLYEPEAEFTSTYRQERHDLSLSLMLRTETDNYQKYKMNACDRGSSVEVTNQRVQQKVSTRAKSLEVRTAV